MWSEIIGSAPKYAGKGIVNPIATIEWIRMMLEHLGEDGAAGDIRDAIMHVIASGEVRTRDMGGTYKTGEVGDAIKRTILS